MHQPGAAGTDKNRAVIRLLARRKSRNGLAPLRSRC